jgi:hypothetical protein
VDEIFEGYHTTIFDLNTSAIPEAERGSFDLVLNCGTSEHVLNQYNVFNVMHDAVRVGGVMYHAIPMTGYLKHGYFTYTPIFMCDLARANQYEIVSLIFIRDVFKDIATATDLVKQHRLTQEALPVFFDMWAGFLMFFLVAVFRLVAQHRSQLTHSAAPTRGSLRFMAQKKVVAVGLATLLPAMAVYNLAVFAMTTFNTLQTGHGAIEPATTFYNDLFTVMIFTDVLILILSLAVSGQYELVFRNAAFVVSIILIRFSLTEGYPCGAPVALMAMIFGILTLLVFNFHMRSNEP